MPTYREIQAYVRYHSGFMPQTTWIAHVLSDHRLTQNRAPNRLDPTARVKPCPPQKRAAIERALRDLGALPRGA
jgi:hypothetical protein